MAQSGVICVEVAGAAYGIPVEDVQEVVGYRQPTRVFHAPAALAGITNLRGEVLPVIDLAALLGQRQDAPLAADPRVVVVHERTGLRRRAGLKVDALLGWREAPATARGELPAALSSRWGALLVGLVSEPPPAFALLSVKAIWDAPALRALSGAALG